VYSSTSITPNTLKLTIFQGSPSSAARVTSSVAPVSANKAPMRWVMLLKRSP